MFLEVLGSGRHVGAHLDGHQIGVSVQSSINMGRSFLRRPRQASYYFELLKFYDFFHDLFKFVMTLGLAVIFKIFKPSLVFEYF